MLASSRTYAFWLAIFRIFLGVFWIGHALPKFTQQDMFLPPNGFMTKVVADAVAATGGPYHVFLANVVQPNIAIFAQAVRFGEALVGISLLLGLVTRLGGLGGMFLSANYMLAQNETSSLHGWSSLDGLTFAASALNFVLPTGRALGFDALFGRGTTSRQPVVLAPNAPMPKAATATGAPVQAEFVDEQAPTDPAAPAS